MTSGPQAIAHTLHPCRQLQQGSEPAGGVGLPLKPTFKLPIVVQTVRQAATIALSLTMGLEVSANTGWAARLIFQNEVVNEHKIARLQAKNHEAH